MPFDPNLPQTNSPVASEELRNQFTGLKELIDNRVTPEELVATEDSIMTQVQERIETQTAGSCADVEQLYKVAQSHPKRIVFCQGLMRQCARSSVG